jgi:hypothetical protein
VIDEAAGGSLIDGIQRLAPAPRRLVGLRHGKRNRALRFLRHPQHHRQVFLDAALVQHELQHAAADLVHRAGNRRQLVLTGLQGRGEVAGRGAMVEGARGREAERSGPHGIARKCRHGLVILRRRRLAARAALAHHIDAQCGVRQLRADVHVEVALREPIHVVRKAFPGPGQSCAQHRLGNILDAFHQLNQPLMI